MVQRVARPGVELSVSTPTKAAALAFMKELKQVIAANNHLGIEDVAIRISGAKVRRIPNTNGPKRDSPVARSQSGLQYLQQRGSGPVRYLDASLKLLAEEADQTLISIGLKDHTYKRIRRARVRTIGDLRMLTLDEISRFTTDVGERTLDDIDVVLRGYGLKLIDYQLWATKPKGRKAQPIATLELSPPLNALLTQAGLQDVRDLAHLSLDEIMVVSAEMNLGYLSQIKCALVGAGYLTK